MIRITKLGNIFYGMVISLDKDEDLRDIEELVLGGDPVILVEDEEQAAELVGNIVVMVDNGE